MPVNPGPPPAPNVTASIVVTGANAAALQTALNTALTTVSGYEAYSFVSISTTADGTNCWATIIYQYYNNA